MISDLNMYKIYDAIIEGKELTTQELKSYGFSSYDLTKLVNNNVLTRIKRGYYALVSIDELYLYGKKLISLKEYTKATICFEKCYEIDPKHLDTNLQLFLRNVQNRKYDLAFEKLDVLLNCDNDCYKNDAKFYLYLLSFITEVPNRYKNVLIELRYEDIKILQSAERYTDSSLPNKIRLSAFNHQISLAIRQWSIYSNQCDGQLNISDIVTIKLLKQAKQVNLENRKKMIELIRNREYDEVVSFLKNREQQCLFLSETDYSILDLSKSIIGILQTGVIPVSRNFNKVNLHNAIKYKNYQLALELCIRQSEEYKFDLEESEIYLLLVEINHLISVLSEQKTSEQSNIPKMDIISKPNNELLRYIEISLINNDFNSAFRAIYSYLSIYNQSHFEMLIINLIKISQLDQDYNFKKIINMLTSIGEGNFIFYEKDYIIELYHAIQQNKYEKAQLYIDILADYNQQLEEDLNNIDEHKKAKILRSVAISRIEAACEFYGMSYTDFVLGVKNNFSEFDRIGLGNTIIKNPKHFIEILESSKRGKNTNKVEIWYDEDDLEQRIQELQKGKDFIILDIMDDDKIYYTTQLLKVHDDITFFTIGFGVEKRLVLKQKKNADKSISFKELVNEANKAYNQRNYPLCIKIYSDLIAMYSPKAFVFAKIGLSYLKMHKSKSAVEYLWLATELDKHTPNGFDFTEVIQKITGTYHVDSPKTETKKIKMTEYDFEPEIENDLEIPYYNQIVSLVVNQGMSIDEACAHFDLTGEKVSLVKLLFARNYYIQGDYVTGDRIVKHVEQTTHKTPLVLQTINELRRDKKFYKNRHQDDTIIVKKITI